MYALLLHPILSSASCDLPTNALAQAFGNIMALHSATSINYDIEPFNPYGTFATESAYPHDHSPLPASISLH